MRDMVVWLLALVAVMGQVVRSQVDPCSEPYPSIDFAATDATGAKGTGRTLLQTTCSGVDPPVPCNPGTSGTVNGFATFFNDQRTLCLGDQPFTGRYGVALNDAVLDGAGFDTFKSSFCGKCISITGVLSGVTISPVQVIDVCDRNGVGAGQCDYTDPVHVDIWDNGEPPGSTVWAELTGLNPDQGRGDVMWQWADC